MFRALLLSKPEASKPEGNFTCELTDISESDLPDHPVSIDVEYSTINYKDGLAICGRPGVVRAWPMVPGIDLVGSVTSTNSDKNNNKNSKANNADGDSDSNSNTNGNTLNSTSTTWQPQPGDKVILNGWDVGEQHWGGLSQKARVRPEWLTSLPDAFTARQAATIGTAGYTAMLCVLELEQHDITPDSGPVLVTGAAGGVGSVAVAVLAKLGYQVVASSGRAETEGDYLRTLGATEVIGRDEFAGDVRPLAKTRWAGAVDVAGSATLAHVISQTQPYGCVTACGLAQGPDLPTSVIPFILRGVTLVGVNCVHEPQQRRDEAWGRLASDLDIEKLEMMTQEIKLKDVQQAAADILEGKVRGRLVVDVNG